MRQEKRAKVEKQKLAELKNQIAAQNQLAGNKSAPKDVQILAAKKDENQSAATVGGAPNLKARSDEERNMVRKREAKALMKSLKLAQMSTASMGKFEKKKKNEPDAPGSQKIVKKKSNSKMFELESNKEKETARNMKIYDLIQRKSEIAVTSGHKSLAHQNEDQIVKKAKRKDDIRRSKTK